MIGHAEDALTKERTKVNERCRDLIATGCVALWEGRAGRPCVVSCMRRLATCHPRPELVYPILSLLVETLAREPSPTVEISAEEPMEPTEEFDSEPEPRSDIAELFAEMSAA